MGAKYDYFHLRDSRAGMAEEAKLTGKPPADAVYTNDIRHGFVYERTPHVTLKSIANNAEIDVIWDRSSFNSNPCEPSSTTRSAGAGKNGKSRARPTTNGPTSRRRIMRRGGVRDASGSAKSMPPSRATPMSNCSTTGPSRLRASFASLVRSRSRAFRRIAFCR